MAKSDFCQTYGCRHAIVLAGMAMIAEPPLVGAVSEAGGLGILGTGAMPPEALRQRIAAVRARTDRPFGVNFIVETTPLGAMVSDAHVAVVLEEAVSPVVFHWNAPESSWVAALSQSGAKVWCTVNTVADAERAAAAGVDAVVAQSLEAGGHNRGAIALAELLPAVARVIGDRHLVAAGGIADAASAAAALALGADAVCLGTRFVACAESPAHAGWKRRIVEAGPGDTAITRLFGPEWPDAPMRVLRNRAVRRAEGSPGGPAPRGPIGTALVGDRRYPMPPASVFLPVESTEGDLEEMCLAAGTSAERIDDDAETAAEIVERIARGL